MSEHVGKLVVLQVLPDPRRYPGPVENPYTSLLVDSLDRGSFAVEYFRWSRVFFQHFDIVHFHWPEYMARHRNPLLAWIKCGLLAAFLLRVRLQHKALVRTVHNQTPHEPGGAAERAVLRSLEGLTTWWVVLNPTTDTPDAARTQLIPHGHYRSWYPRSRRPAHAGAALLFGLLRAYKGAEDLIRAFAGLPPDSSYRLRICGKPATEEDARTIESAIRGHAGISADLRFLDDRELSDALAEAEVAILPYRAMHNSGAALLALSLNRPVIIPQSPAADLLVEEFGDAWVVTYEGEITTVALVHALNEVRARVRAPDVVDMSAREWPALARQLEAVYRRAVRDAR